jgi:hypothetical protein
VSLLLLPQAVTQHNTRGSLVSQLGTSVELPQVQHAPPRVPRTWLVAAEAYPSAAAEASYISIHEILRYPFTLWNVRHLPVSSHAGSATVVLHLFVQCKLAGVFYTRGLICSASTAAAVIRKLYKYRHARGCYSFFVRKLQSSQLDHSTSSSLQWPSHLVHHCLGVLPLMIPPNTATQSQPDSHVPTSTLQVATTPTAR